MKVDLSKYKAFKVEIKEMSVKEARSIEEPYVTKSPFNYSFFWNQIYFVLPVYLDNTYKNKEQLEKDLDIPVLGVIPMSDLD